MLVTLGARRASGDGVDLLLECHGRIRQVLAVARRLAAGGDASASEVRDAAARIHRYFAEALPLHVRDEDETVRALLAGAAPAVAAALTQMSAEHEAHLAPLGELLAICAQLETHPEQLDAVVDRLRPLVATLEADLLAHLELEERVIFPALRALPGSARAHLTAEIRGRRTTP